MINGTCNRNKAIWQRKPLKMTFLSKEKLLKTTLQRANTNAKTYQFCHLVKEMKINNFKTSAFFILIKDLTCFNLPMGEEKVYL